MIHFMKRLCFILSFFMASLSIIAADELLVLSWNWEHFGSPGRGFPSLDLPQRDNSQLKELASLLEKMEADIVCLQEIALDSNEEPYTNFQLDKMARLLGRNWQYIIAPPAFPKNFEVDSPHNLQNAYLWNKKRVTLETSFILDFPAIKASGKQLFARSPYCAYFISEKGNDFVICNLHLSSGQQYDENHLAALILVEQNLSAALRKEGITESDRMILGDFNDSCGRSNEKTSRLIPEYFKTRNYFLLSRELEGITRIGDNGGSFIDQIAANNSMMKHLSGTIKLYSSSDFNMTNGYFRKNMSDHLPMEIRVLIGPDDDAD